MNRAQRDQQVRQWNMHQQPALKQALQTRLAVEISFLFANIFQVIDDWPDRLRSYGAQLGKDGLGRTSFCHPVAVGAALLKIGLDGLLVYLPYPACRLIAQSDQR